MVIWTGCPTTSRDLVTCACPSFCMRSKSRLLTEIRSVFFSLFSFVCLFLFRCSPNKHLPQTQTNKQNKHKQTYTQALYVDVAMRLCEFYVRQRVGDNKVEQVIEDLKNIPSMLWLCFVGLCFIVCFIWYLCCLFCDVFACCVRVCTPMPLICT